MPIKQYEVDFSSMESIIRSVRSQCRSSALKAAEKAEDEVENKFLQRLREEFSNCLVYVYDESHQNRFVMEPLREWNAVAKSFDGCIALAMERFKRMGENHSWAMEQALQTYLEQGQKPTLTQYLVFQAGHSWYCFFCLEGSKFCDIVRERLACRRKHEKEEANRPRGCDNYDNL